MGNTVAAPRDLGKDLGTVLRDELPQLQLGRFQLLRSSKFMKTALLSSSDGAEAVVKVHNLPAAMTKSDVAALQTIAQRIFELRSAFTLYRTPHAVPYGLSFVGMKHNAAFMVRQHTGTSLADRVHSRPFLSYIERLWLTFQLLKALQSAHAKGICHGDLHPENVLVLAHNWLLLVDWAPYKPTFLPLEDPANYIYFFGSGDKRRCCVAPERFCSEAQLAEMPQAQAPPPAGASTAAGSINGNESSASSAFAGASLSALARQQATRTIGGPPSGASAPPTEAQQGASDPLLLPSMDIFSAGCVLAELWCGGRALLELPDILRYRSWTAQPGAEHAAPDKADGGALPSLQHPRYAAAEEVGILSFLRSNCEEYGGEGGQQEGGAIARLLAHMLHQDPTQRWSADTYLHVLTASGVFPASFQGILHPLQHQALARDAVEADERIALVLGQYGPLLRSTAGVVDEVGEHVFAQMGDNLALEQEEKQGGRPRGQRVLRGATVQRDAEDSDEASPEREPLSPLVPSDRHLPASASAAVASVAAAAAWEWAPWRGGTRPVCVTVEDFYRPWVPAVAWQSEVLPVHAHWRSVAASTLAAGRAQEAAAAVLLGDSGEGGQGGAGTWEVIETYADVSARSKRGGGSTPIQGGGGVGVRRGPSPLPLPMLPSGQSLEVDDAGVYSDMESDVSEASAGMDVVALSEADEVGRAAKGAPQMAPPPPNRDSPPGASSENVEFAISAEHAEAICIVLPLITSAARSLSRPQLKVAAIAMLGRLATLPAPAVSDTVRLDRVLPYLVEFLQDTSPHVRTHALLALTGTLEALQDFPATHAQLFGKFVNPATNKLQEDPSGIVRAALAGSLARLSAVAQRFDDISQWRAAGRSLNRVAIPPATETPPRSTTPSASSPSGGGFGTAAAGAAPKGDTEAADSGAGGVPQLQPPPEPRRTHAASHNADVDTAARDVSPVVHVSGKDGTASLGEEGDLVPSSGHSQQALLRSRVKAALQTCIVQLAMSTGTSAHLSTFAVQSAVNSPAVASPVPAAGGAPVHAAVVAQAAAGFLRKWGSVAHDDAGSDGSESDDGALSMDGGSAGPSLGTWPAASSAGNSVASLLHRCQRQLQNALEEMGDVTRSTTQDALSVWREFCFRLSSNKRWDDDPSAVRLAILDHLPEFAVLLGSEDTEEFLLPFLTTFLNDSSDWQTHALLLQQLPGLALVMGAGGGEELLLPMCVTGLHDPQPPVAQAAADALSSMLQEHMVEPRAVLAALGLLQCPAGTAVPHPPRPAPPTPQPGNPQWGATQDTFAAHWAWQEQRMYAAWSAQAFIGNLLLHPSRWLRQGTARLVASIAFALGPAEAPLLLMPLLHLPLRPCADGEARVWGVFREQCRQLGYVSVRVNRHGTTQADTQALPQWSLQEHARARRVGWSFVGGADELQAAHAALTAALQEGAFPPLPRVMWDIAVGEAMQSLPQQSGGMDSAEASPFAYGTATVPPAPEAADAQRDIEGWGILRRLVATAAVVDPITSLALANSQCVSAHRAAVAEGAAGDPATASDTASDRGGGDSAELDSPAPSATPVNFFSDVRSPGAVFHGFMGLAPLRVYQLALLTPFALRTAKASLSSYSARVRLQVACTLARKAFDAAGSQLQAVLSEDAQQAAQASLRGDGRWTVPLPSPRDPPSDPPEVAWGSSSVVQEWYSCAPQASPAQDDGPGQLGVAGADASVLQALLTVHQLLVNVPAQGQAAAVTDPHCWLPPPVPAPYSAEQMSRLKRHTLNTPDGRYASVFPAVPHRVRALADEIPHDALRIDGNAMPTKLLPTAHGGSSSPQRLHHHDSSSMRAVRAAAPMDSSLLLYACRDTAAAASLFPVSPPGASANFDLLPQDGTASEHSVQLWHLLPRALRSDSSLPQHWAQDWGELLVRNRARAGRRARRLHLSRGVHSMAHLPSLGLAQPGSIRALRHATAADSRDADMTLYSSDEDEEGTRMQGSRRDRLHPITSLARVGPSFLATEYAAVVGSAILSSVGDMSSAGGGGKDASQRSDSSGGRHSSYPVRRHSVAQASGAPRRLSSLGSMGSLSLQLMQPWQPLSNLHLAQAEAALVQSRHAPGGWTGQRGSGTGGTGTGLDMDAGFLNAGYLRVGEDSGDSTSVLLALPGLGRDGQLAVRFGLDGRIASASPSKQQPLHTGGASHRDMDFMHPARLAGLVRRVQALAVPPVPPFLGTLRLSSRDRGGVRRGDKVHVLIAQAVRNTASFAASSGVGGGTGAKSAAGLGDMVMVAGGPTGPHEEDSDDDWLCEGRDRAALAPVHSSGGGATGKGAVPLLAQLLSQSASTSAQLLEDALAQAQQDLADMGGVGWDTPLPVVPEGGGLPDLGQHAGDLAGAGTGYPPTVGADPRPLYGLTGGLFPFVPRALPVQTMSQSSNPGDRALVAGSRPLGLLFASVDAHEAGVNCLLPAQDHSFVLTGSDDGTAKVWITSLLVKRFFDPRPITAQLSAPVLAACTIDSTAAVAVACLDGTVQVLHVDVSVRPPSSTVQLLAESASPRGRSMASFSVRPPSARRPSASTGGGAVSALGGAPTSDMGLLPRGSLDRRHWSDASAWERMSSGSEVSSGLRTVLSLRYPDEGGVIAVHSYTTPTQVMLVSATPAGGLHGFDLRARQSQWSFFLPPSLGSMTCMELFSGVGHGRGYSEGTQVAIMGTSRGMVAVFDLRFQRLVRVWAHPSQAAVTCLKPYLSRGLDTTKKQQWVFNYISAATSHAAVPESSSLPTCKQLAVALAVQGHGCGFFNMETGRCMRQLRVLPAAAGITAREALASFDLLPLDLLALGAGRTAHEAGLPRAAVKLPRLPALGNTILSLQWPLPSPSSGNDTGAEVEQIFVLNGTRGTGALRVGLQEGACFAGHTAYQWQASNAADEAVAQSYPGGDVLSAPVAEAFAHALWEGYDWYAADLASLPVWLLTAGADGAVRCWDLHRPRASHTVCGIDSSCAIVPVHVYDAHPSVPPGVLQEGDDVSQVPSSSAQQSFVLLCRASQEDAVEEVDSMSVPDVWRQGLLPRKGDGGSEGRVGQVPTNHKAAVHALSFVDSGRRFALSVGADGDLKLWR